MKTKALFLGVATLMAVSSCRYTHKESNDGSEPSATETMAEGQGGETDSDTTTAADIQQTIPQDSTKSSNPQGDISPRE